MLLALSVVLVAINLRPAVAGVGPVLPELRAGLPLSGIGAAALTTVPVLCFGLLATVAPRLARRFGIEPVLAGVMAALAAGALVRVLDGPPVLFAGSVVAGGAIAIGNVLLPPLIKRDFPDRSGLMMGVYTMAVSGAAASRPGSRYRWPTRRTWAGGARSARGRYRPRSRPWCGCREREATPARPPRPRRAGRCCATRWPGS